MSIIVCSDIALSYGDNEILKKISFAVNPGDKVGIIGVNGAGKSTLFLIILGEKQPTSGSVSVRSDTRIGCLSQINDAHRFGCSVYSAALAAFPELLSSEIRLEALRRNMESGDETAISAFVTENEHFIRNGGNEFRAKTRSLLEKFGFSKQELDKSADSLSGGQKTKLLLAKLLLSEPDILLLDEPTNHLDTDACEWLEGFVSQSKKTFLIISHDRYFLDRVTGRTLEISRGICEMYDGSYSVFREKKKALDAAKLKHYGLQQKEIKRIEAFIENQKKWNREKNIIAAESRQKQLDKMVKLDRPAGKERGISFSVAHSGSKGNDILSVRGLAKSFPGTFLFDGLSFEMHKGDRLFVLGANGSGKSTLMKIITGRETQDRGVFELGYNQTVGYYDQEQQLLDTNNTVIDELWSVYADRTCTEIRGMLARFGFYGEDVFKKVDVLSGGERARLSIAKMISCGVSLLVLDEPTNHLDIDSREMLEKALSEYDGTLLAVSHDRYFINSLADRILELDKNGYPEGYRFYPCGYEEFIRTRKKSPSSEPKESENETGRDSFEEAKQKKNRLRAAKARAEKCENEIETLEKQLAGIRNEISDEAASSDYVRLGGLYAEQDEAEKKISALYAEFDALDTEISSSETE